MPKFTVFFALLLSFNAQAATIAEMKTTGVLRLATEGAFPPFNFYQGGQLSGFEVELGNQIAKTMKLKPEWLTMAFGTLLIGLDQDRYDVVISSHAVTPEREKSVLFVSPHYCSGGVIVAKAGGPQTTGALAGKVVSAQQSSIYPKILETIPGIKEVKTFLKDEDSIHALIAGTVNATVTDKFLARDLVNKVKGQKLEISPIFNPEKNAIAVAKSNGELRNEVEKTLKELMKNGFYEKLSKKYFGEDIRCK